MPRRKTHVIVASSGGIDAKGAHIITPDSVISYVDTDDKELKISQTLASGPVSIKINPIWTHELLDVTLPVQRLYEHIPISPALIKRFIENTNEKFGGEVCNATPSPAITATTQLQSFSFYTHHILGLAPQSKCF